MVIGKPLMKRVNSPSSAVGQSGRRWTSSFCRSALELDAKTPLSTVCDAYGKSATCLLDLKVQGLQYVAMRQIDSTRTEEQSHVSVFSDDGTTSTM